MSVIIIPQNTVLDESNYDPTILSEKLDASIHINLIHKLKEAHESKKDIYVWVSKYHCGTDFCIAHGGFNKEKELSTYRMCENEC